VNAATKGGGQADEHTFNITHHYRPADPGSHTRTVGVGELSPEDAHAFIDDRLAGPPYRFSGAADDAPDDAQGGRHGRRALPAGKGRTSPDSASASDE
jgi:hypothetical protein